MSLQDDCFDVSAKLEGTPEAKQFDRIWETFCRLEEWADNQQDQNLKIRAGIAAFLKLAQDL